MVRTYYGCGCGTFLTVIAVILLFSASPILGIIALIVIPLVLHKLNSNNTSYYSSYTNEEYTNIDKRHQAVLEYNYGNGGRFRVTMLYTQRALQELNNDDITIGVLEQRLAIASEEFVHFLNGLYANRKNNIDGYEKTLNEAFNQANKHMEIKILGHDYPAIEFNVTRLK